MKLIKSLLIGSLLVGGIAIAQDPHKVGPSIYKVKLENEKCRVYEITFKPGASIGMHSHPDHVVYILSPGTLEITEKGKAPAKITGKVGDTFFLTAQSHSAKNVGKTTVRAVVVELR